MSGIKNAEDKMPFNLKSFINVKTIKLAKALDGSNKEVYCFQMLLCDPVIQKHLRFPNKNVRDSCQEYRLQLFKILFFKSLPPQIPPSGSEFCFYNILFEGFKLLRHFWVK